MEGWVDHVGWPTADGITTKRSLVQLAVWRRIGKVRWPKPAFYPLCYATNDGAQSPPKSFQHYEQPKGILHLMFRCDSLTEYDGLLILFGFCVLTSLLFQRLRLVTLGFPQVIQRRIFGISGAHELTKRQPYLLLSHFSITLIKTDYHLVHCIQITTNTTRLIW